ncbi:rhodanese-like domain-containing protein [Marinilabiliaceae bacterium JC017]|nr:rhodanese-like domain-containing protein [Marinilabiliaceae bacterium JC017]
MMRAFLVILFLGGILTFSNGQKQQKVRYLQPSRFYESMTADSNVVILDVRVFEAYSEGRILDAIWVGEKRVLEEVLPSVAKDQMVLVYCSYGSHRAEAVVDILKEKGYKNIGFLVGGFNKWKRQKFETDTSKVEHYERQ